MRRRLFLSALAAPALRAQPSAATTRHRAPRALKPAARTSDWPSFLGPTHDGFSPETHLTSSFPAAGPPLVWERTKGTGYSSPTLAQGKLVFLHRMGSREIVECLHPETGALLWSFDYPTVRRPLRLQQRPPLQRRHRQRPRPPLSAESPPFTLHLDSGKLAWKLDLRSAFGVKQDFFGVATTPSSNPAN
ncbi:MAG: hypothetical protein IPJ98_07335 [Bryobacterales bacterium]|nr:hypothetical protein [Bryobacterales bacterium]